MGSMTKNIIKKSINLREGIRRIILVLSLGLIIAYLWAGAQSYISSYNFFSMQEKNPESWDLPQKIFGEGYSLPWILVKNLTSLIFESVSAFLALYYGLLAFFDLLRWIGKFINRGFKERIN
jgi:hypothetical protein